MTPGAGPRGGRRAAVCSHGQRGPGSTRWALGPRRSPFPRSPGTAGRASDVCQAPARRRGQKQDGGPALAPQGCTRPQGVRAAAALHFRGTPRPYGKAAAVIGRRPVRAGRGDHPPGGSVRLGAHGQHPAPWRYRRGQSVEAGTGGSWWGAAGVAQRAPPPADPSQAPPPTLSPAASYRSSTSSWL